MPSGFTGRWRSCLLEVAEHTAHSTGLTPIQPRQTLHHGPFCTLYGARRTGIGIAPEMQTEIFRALRASRWINYPQIRWYRLRIDYYKTTSAHLMGGSMGSRQYPRAKVLRYFLVYRVSAKSRRHGVRAAPEQHQGLEGRRVLIVDENATNRTSACVSGSRRGHAPRECRRFGPQALERFAQLRLNGSHMTLRCWI